MLQYHYDPILMNNDDPQNNVVSDIVFEAPEEVTRKTTSNLSRPGTKVGIQNNMSTSINTYMKLKSQIIPNVIKWRSHHLPVIMIYCACLIIATTGKLTNTCIHLERHRKLLNELR